MVMWTGWDFPPSYIGAYHNVMPGTILRVCYFSVTKKMPGFGLDSSLSIRVAFYPDPFLQFDAVALFYFCFVDCCLYVRRVMS